MRFLILTLSVFLFSVSTGAKQDIPSGNKFKKEFLERINKVRQKGCNCGRQYMKPAPPLVWNEQLEDAAMGHAKDMYKKSYFSHDSKDGRKIVDRIEAAGYGRKGFRTYQVGENIAQGQLSIEEVTDGWFKSEGHCYNLMQPGFKEIGVAWYNTYWVQDFGGREEFSDEVKKLIKSGKARIIERE
ncbi:CAP domain-containing protein [Mucilaginibacter calamicampi]|uniref:CAP domain-containing protein n=1 Tax=Mucilaginibacter calamicampi TaxID=1302352 RepID=A0ABW2YUR9_9SPHI